VSVSGPLSGPRQLRVEEQQSYNRDYRYRDSSLDIEGHLSKSNSSEDRIHLMIRWKARNIFYVDSNLPFSFVEV